MLHGLAGTGLVTSTCGDGEVRDGGSSCFQGPPGPLSILLYLPKAAYRKTGGFVLAKEHTWTEAPKKQCSQKLNNKQGVGDKYPSLLALGWDTSAVCST